MEGIGLDWFVMKGVCWTELTLYRHALHACNSVSVEHRSLPVKRICTVA